MVIGPDVVLRVRADLGHDGVDAGFEAFEDLCGSEGVNGVAGYDGVAELGEFGVETGGAIAAAENPAGEVGFSEGEHAAVFVEGPAPGDDLVELDAHAIANAKGQGKMRQ